ncbi:MAG: F0F1 ATP synthase subunit A [Lachnospiraceae bacterium]|nr:F0F1 ATP synthase subunit A [Lachnospiraceae bacterium]
MNYGLLLSTDNIDFMIHKLVPFNFFGTEVWITDSHVCVLIVMLILVIFSIIAGNKFKKALANDQMEPDGFQNFVEAIIDFLQNTVGNAMGKSADRYFNYIATIFMFILVSNISGLLGLRPPTADWAVTLPMALITFSLIHINEVKFAKSPLALWADKCSPLPPWLPIWLPINIISDIAVPISLSLRLFANVLSGTVMMALIYGLLGWIATAWPAALHVYFDLFSGAIQTYVFCMLTMTYIASARGEA